MIPRAQAHGEGPVGGRSKASKKRKEITGLERGRSRGHQVTWSQHEDSRFGALRLG